MESTREKLVDTRRRAALPAVPPGQLRFAPEDAFLRDLRRRVDDHFRQTGKKQRDVPRMYVKSAVILTWFALSYALLVFVAASWWVAIPLMVSLALSMAAIGFNVQHDGGHGAFSERTWVNRLAALTLDLMGGSSYVWDRKHNSIHHTYSNITGHDDDINIGAFGRLTPHQKRYPFHRFQHLYLWILYGLLPLKWQIYDDFRDVIAGKSGVHTHARPRGWNLAAFLGGKIAFFSLALVIPSLVHSFGTAIGAYAMVTFIEGIALSFVFQLPHCGDQAAFPVPDETSGRMLDSWSVNQILTTVNYARDNRLLTWYVGGLNFQIEHHLFPRICHLHYPAIAPIVEQTCQEYGVQYKAHDTFSAAIISHLRWLREMGKPDPITASLDEDAAPESDESPVASAHTD